jgi:hypothetical protein
MKKEIRMLTYYLYSFWISQKCMEKFKINLFKTQSATSYILMHNMEYFLNFWPSQNPKKIYRRCVPNLSVYTNYSYKFVGNYGNNILIRLFIKPYYNTKNRAKESIISMRLYCLTFLIIITVFDCIYDLLPKTAK